MSKIPFSNKIKNKNLYINERNYKTSSSLGKIINEKQSHSFIFNYSGLNNILLKYNSNMFDNKSFKEEESMRTGNIKNYSYRKKRNDNKKREKENITEGIYSKKLKEINSNMNLLLSEIKSNLESPYINSDIKQINADNFINQFNIQKFNNSSINNKNNDSRTFEYLKYSFSFMKICNFNFEIINKKNYILNVDNLNEEFKKKLDFIFDKKLNTKELFVDNLINLLYDYNSKLEEIKIYNKDIISKYFNNNDEFNKEMEKYLEAYKIDENNKKIHNEIDFLTDKLTYSFYKDELLLNKYYNKLKEIDINVEKNIETIINNNFKEN